MIIYCAQCERHLVDHVGQLCPVCRPSNPGALPPLLAGPSAHYYVDTDGQLFAHTTRGWVPVDAMAF